MLPEGKKVRYRHMCGGYLRQLQGGTDSKAVRSFRKITEQKGADVSYRRHRIPIFPGKRSVPEEMGRPLYSVLIPRNRWWDG